MPTQLHSISGGVVADMEQVAVSIRHITKSMLHELLLRNPGRLVKAYRLEI